MFILGSSSARRLELLQQVGIKIDKIIDPAIDETPLKFEPPIKYVERLSRAKSENVEKDTNDFALTADTIVTKGRRIFGKPQDIIEAEKFLNLLSGGRHRVITSVCLAHNDKTKVRNVVTIVKMKRLSISEVNQYLESEEWRNKAGGYAIQGKAAKFIPSIFGSYTNVVGLPLTETVNLLTGTGYPLKTERNDK